MPESRYVRYGFASFSGKKKEPKPKLVGADIFGWGGGLPREWVEAKKFGMSLETREINSFGGISRDFAGIPAVPEKFEKKKFVFDFRPLAFTAFPYLPSGWMEREFASKAFLSYSLGGGGRLCWDFPLFYFKCFRDRQPAQHK